MISTDAGLSWTPVPMPDGATELLGFDHQGSIHVRGLGAGTLFRSDDLGQSWNPIQVPEGFENGSFWFDSNPIGTVLLVYDFDGWALSSDGGRSFAARPSFGAPSSVRISPENPRRLLVGVDEYRYFYSGNGGADFRELIPPNTSIEQVRFHPDRPGWLVESNLGPSTVSERGSTWRQAGLGVPAAGFRHFAFEQDPDRTWAATSAGLARSMDGGRSWTLPALDGLDIDRVFVSVEGQRLLVLDHQLLLRVSSDGGQTFRDPKLVGFPWVPDPHVPGRFLVGSYPSVGWVEIRDWDPDSIVGIVTDDGLASEFRDVAFASGVTGLAYALDRLGRNVLVSTDGGLHFETVGPVPDALLPGAAGLAVDGDGTLYVRGFQQVFRSSDGGRSFQSLAAFDSLGELDSISHLVPDAQDPDALFALGFLEQTRSEGNGVLLWRSEDDGQTFVDISTGVRKSGPEAGGFAQSPEEPDLLFYGGFTLFRRDGSDPDPCLASDDVLCLRDDRFEVRLRFGDLGDGLRPPARAVTARARDSGLFTFFDPNNWELMVKVLDACSINGHRWVLGAASTNVGYDLVVSDVETGLARVYSNPVGNLAPAIIDLEAFPCTAP